MRIGWRSLGAGRNGTPPPRPRGYEGRPGLFNAARGVAAALALLLPILAHAATPPRILAFGDSLTAGFGLPAEHALPVRLAAKLKSEGLEATIVNAGVSGETTAGGLARLDWALGEKPDIVILELGANDALRGIDPKVTHENLDKMLTKLKASGARILLVGMLAPSNWGPEYKRAFDAIYPELAAKHGVPLDPFILEGVAMDPALNQPDMLHPNEKGVEVIAARMAPYVKHLVEEGGAR
jgi:acyl-CoA thioesterase-1